MHVRKLHSSTWKLLKLYKSKQCNALRTYYTIHVLCLYIRMCIICVDAVWKHWEDQCV